MKCLHQGLSQAAQANLSPTLPTRSCLTKRCQVFLPSLPPGVCTCVLPPPPPPRPPWDALLSLSLANHSDIHSAPSDLPCKACPLLPVVSLHPGLSKRSLSQAPWHRAVLVGTASPTPPSSRFHCPLGGPQGPWRDIFSPGGLGWAAGLDFISDSCPCPDSAS